MREPEPCLFPPTRFFAVWAAGRCRRARAGGRALLVPAVAALAVLCGA